MVAALLGFVARSAHAEPEAAAPNGAESPVPVGAFVDLEWRVTGFAGHALHGPAFAAGATFADGLVRVGLAGSGRPGPVNPAAFVVTLPRDQTYKGRHQLELKSDGAMLGVHLGFSFRLPFEEAIALQLPITVGYGGFGFYLHGEDRNTPDGRRVSEWENELFDGRDSFLGLVLDGGVRVAFEPSTLPWLMPYMGVAVTVLPGFETLVSHDDLGVSGVLGIELGHGL